MKAIILTCNTGQGHNSVSKAINGAFTLREDECATIDSLSFISDMASSAISSWHTRLYRYMPKVFNFGYNIAEANPELFEDGSPIRKFLVSGAGRLYDYLIDGGYDCVICPHVFSGLMMTQLSIVHPDMSIKTSFIATDYTFTPITAEMKLDAYFVPDSELVPVYASVGIPEEKIYPITGIPVRREFYNHIDKKNAKKQLGIDSDSKHVIMMFGSMGCGPISRLTSEISKVIPKNSVLTVICGTNEILRKLLAYQYKNSENVRIEGFVDNIPLLMDSADLYVTKPGGLSTSEARIKHLPMLLVNAVAGCEKTNLEFMVKKGAAVTAHGEAEIAALCNELINDDKRLCKMSRAFNDTKIAADEIYDTLKNMSQRINNVSA